MDEENALGRLQRWLAGNADLAARHEDTVLLLDDLDAYETPVRTLVKAQLRRAPGPVILTCSDPFHKDVRALQPRCAVVRIGHAAGKLRTAMCNVLLAHAPDAKLGTPAAFEALMDNVDGNWRRLFMHVQLALSSSQSSQSSQSQSSLRRSVYESVFETAAAMFRRPCLEWPGGSDDFMLTTLLAQNYPEQCAPGSSRGVLGALGVCADLWSLHDTLLHRVPEEITNVYPTAFVPHATNRQRQQCRQPRVRWHTQPASCGAAAAAGLKSSWERSRGARTAVEIPLV